MSAPPSTLPGRLWRWVGEFLSGTAPDPEAIGEALVEWADGRSPEELQALLDALRSRGAYPISLHVLEATWNAEVPLDMLGRVAEDWIGTVWRGLGDRAGALVVAQHLVTRALELGPAFAGDLGDLLLNWRMFEPAGPLVTFAAQRQPGDMALRYNLGVVQKMAGDWAGCRASFTAVLAHHEDPAVRWHLALACTALELWAEARTHWAQLDYPLPSGDGDFAQPSEAVAIALPSTQGNEVVWGQRLGPCRARLITLPCISTFAGHGDLLLLDGAKVGDTPYPDGSTGPILSPLAVLACAHAKVWFCVGEAQEAPRFAQAAAQLSGQGWPVNDWSGLNGDARARLAIAVLPPHTSADVVAQCAALNLPVLQEQP